MNETLCTCADCGRTIKLSESSESGHGTDYLCEFFYCADRKACEVARMERDIERAEE